MTIITDFCELTVSSCDVLEEILVFRKEAKRKVFAQDLYCWFHISGCELKVPVIFHVVLV